MIVKVTLSYLPNCRLTIYMSSIFEIYIGVGKSRLTCRVLSPLLPWKFCMIALLTAISEASDMPSERISFTFQKNSQKAQKNLQIASAMPAVGRNQPSTRSTGVKIENWPPKFQTILQKLVIQRAALRTCLTEMKMLTLTVTAVILIVMITLTTTYMYTLIFLLLVLHFLV